MSTNRLLLFVSVVLLVPTLASGREPFGSIRGRVVVDGDVPPPGVLMRAGRHSPGFPKTEVPDDSLQVHSQNHGLANVLVFLTDVKRVRSAQAAIPNGPVVMEINDGRFQSRAFILRTGQHFGAKSHDGLTYYLRLQGSGNPPVHNWPVPGSAALAAVPLRSKAEAEPVQVFSNVHPWMKAWVLVLDHPYAAITDENGRFQINLIPVGDYHVRVWHEKAGDLRPAVPVSVRDRKIAPIETVRVSADALSP